MPARFFSLGAAQEVTGSKHVLEIDGERILVDCGAFQGVRAEADKKNREFSINPSEISAAVLTHAHYDHCGLLPVLHTLGYKGTIYATPASRDLAALIMMDSAHIQARDAEYLGKQAVKSGTSFDWKPLFGERDVLAVVNQFVTVSYEREILLSPRVRMTFHDAGHILGSAMASMNVEPPNGKPFTITFSGDLGRRHKPIIRDPQPIPPPNYLVLESTYGNRLHDPSEGAMERLAATVRETAKKRGKILIPAFAIERTQELIYYFHLLTDQKRIPEIPIFVDSPMATNATSIFRVHPECYDDETNRAFIDHHENPFGFNELHYTESVAESKKLNDLDGPAIIIAADGMCEAGRIQHHLLHNIEDPNNTVLIVGFMADHTLGRRIRDRESTVKIFGQRYQLKARVETIDAFSAHADYSEIVEYLKSIDTRNLRRIFLVHGEPDAQRGLIGHLSDAGFTNVTVSKYGETYELT